MDVTLLKKIILFTSVAVAASSCGGGESSSGGNTVTVPPTPAPTPAPTPTPPSPSYATAFDFSADRSFISPMAKVYQVERYTSDAPPYYSLESSGGEIFGRSFQRAKFSYDHASETFSISHEGKTSAFGPSDIYHKDEGSLRFQRRAVDTPESDQLFLYKIKLMKFVALGTQYTRTAVREPGQAAGVLLTTRYFLFGVPTITSDIPTSGDFSYQPELITSTPYGADGGGSFAVNSGNIQISQGMARMTGTLDIAQVSWVTGSEQEKGQITLSGTVKADTNEISGSISG